jgi:hypothetical protein
MTAFIVVRIVFIALQSVFPWVQSVFLQGHGFRNYGGFLGQVGLSGVRDVGDAAFLISLKSDDLDDLRFWRLGLLRRGGAALDGGARSAGLLHGVHEFVSQQRPALGCRWSELPRGKNHILADGVGAGMDRGCRAGGDWVGVNPNVAEITREARLHERACGSVQGQAGRSENVLNDGRGCE